MCGYGRIIFNNGSYYQGMFENNAMHGLGTYYNAMGETTGE